MHGECGNSCNGIYLNVYTMVSPMYIYTNARPRPQRHLNQRHSSSEDSKTIIQRTVSSALGLQMGRADAQSWAAGPLSSSSCHLLLLPTRPNPQVSASWYQARQGCYFVMRKSIRPALRRGSSAVKDRGQYAH